MYVKKNEKTFDIFDPEDRSRYLRKLENVMREVVILRFLDIIKTGPQMRKGKGFDIVTYTDSIEFFMEKCEPLSLR